MARPSSPTLRFFRVELRGPVAVCLLDKPPANTLDAELHADFALLLAWLEDTTAVRATVFGSANEKIFMAGAKLEDYPDEHFRAEATAERVDRAHETFMRVQRLRVPVIAAITGHALGGGCELALACDFRFMTEDENLIGCPEIRLGIIPGGGGTQRLPRLVGRSHATKLLFLGERLGAAAAREIGLVDEVHSTPEATVAGAIELASRLAELPSPALALLKRCLNNGFDASLPDGLAVERQAAIEALAQPEAREGIRAFLERRQPDFRR